MHLMAHEEQTYQHMVQVDEENKHIGKYKVVKHKDHYKRKRIERVRGLTSKNNRCLLIN